MTTEVGRTHIVDVEAGAQVPPEGHFLYARDTDNVYKSDGTTLTIIDTGGGGYSDEQAQDAVGSMVDSTLTYVDGTPALGVADDGITDAKLRNSAALSVIGRSANSTGNPGDIVGATVGDVLQVLTGPVVGFGSLGLFNVRRPSWDNQPESPNSMDDEFDEGTLDAKWTIASSGTTNPATTGTVDYTASLTTPIVDASTVYGHLMVQSDNSSLGYVTVYQAYTPATDATFFAKFGWNNRAVSGNGEGNLSIILTNTADANEWITFGMANNGTISSSYGQVNNNGALTTVFGAGYGEGAPVGSGYVAMWKKSDVYYFGSAADGKSVFTVIGSVTKTGVTTFDRLSIEFRTGNETPSIVDGIDFFRYQPSLNYSLVNP